jgi:hypothetical protein
MYSTLINELKLSAAALSVEDRRGQAPPLGVHGTVRNYLSSAIGKTGTRNRKARQQGWL